MLHPFTSHWGVAESTFFIGNVHLKDIKMRSKNDSSATERAEGLIPMMTRHISNINIPQTISNGNLISLSIGN
jgi:hypothetical protein